MTPTQWQGLARILPFAAYILFLALSTPLTDVISLVGLDARWLYAIRAGVAAALLLWLWRGYAELTWPMHLTIPGFLTALLAGALVFVVWVAPYPEWAVFNGGAGFDPTRRDGEGLDVALVAVRLAGASLVVPLMEELFWRSFLMRWIDRDDFLSADPGRASLKAFSVAALMFALEHSLWMAGLAAGVIYGWLYRRYRNLWVPVLAHAVTNGMLGLWVLQNHEWRYW